MARGLHPDRTQSRPRTNVALTRLALGELAVAAGGPGHPGRVTLAAVGAREVDAAARAASSRILALIHVYGTSRGLVEVVITIQPGLWSLLLPRTDSPGLTHLLWAQTLALCGAVLCRRRAGAAVAAASVLTHSVPAVRLIQALIHVCGEKTGLVTGAGLVRRFPRKHL